MTIIPTHELRESTRMSAGDNLQVYCGLDSMLTLEIWQALREQRPQPPAIYAFERALQAPYMEIMQRGFAVNEGARLAAVRVLRHRLELIDGKLQQMAGAVWSQRDRKTGRALNPASPKQLQEFFYGAMNIPEVIIRQKGVPKISTNREALEKILDQHMHARPLINCILASRDIAKQLMVFEMGFDLDGPSGKRFRAGYNIAGTETGRPSSSQNAFGTGGNAQNIAPGLRYVFEADPGMRMCVIDLEQVEARDVGWFCGCLFGDWRFLDSCESGDLHSNNAKLIWPELPWTGDPKADRALAETNFYREFSHRDMAKRGSHLSNYSGTAWTAARSLKVPQIIMDEFQARYCRGGVIGGKRIDPAFPAIAQWWRWTAEQIQRNHKLVTPFGRERHFFGRATDDTTLREAIAFLPQSTTADRMNLGLWRVWRYMPQVQLLAQTYDSITFQYPESADEGAIVAEALERIRVPMYHPNGREYVVPGEAKVGWNWGGASAKNPEGLIKWKPGLVDARKRRVGLDRIIH